MITYIHEDAGWRSICPSTPAKIVEPEVPVETPAQLPVTQPQSIAATPVVQSSADISDIQPKLISVLSSTPGTLKISLKWIRTLKENWELTRSNKQK